MALHPRNKHQGHYDFPVLIQACPELAQVVAPTPHGQLSVDFANPQAVKLLNHALLIHYYGLRDWDLPPGYLCPPIPGRADYVHTVADLLSERTPGAIPRGGSVRGLDIGVGANCIYPILGFGEYEWSFVGADVDQVALEASARFLKANPAFSAAIKLRKQPSAARFFDGIVDPQEHFDFSICNPPFHASAAEALAGTQRKWKNLRRTPASSLNFGGKNSELWFPGGELAFIRGMIDESRAFSKNVGWFTALVSKESHLPAVEAAVKKAKAREFRVLNMSQGQKKSRVVAWTYLTR